MKINEIVQEGILDNLKGKIGRYQNSQAMKQAGKLGASAWKKYLAGLEAANDYNEIQPGLVKTHLRNWIDQSLFGRYSLNTAPGPIQQSVNAFIGQLAQDPKDTTKLQKAFSAILNQTRKMQLDPAAKATQQKPVAGGKQICDQPTKQIGDSLFICGKEIKRGDPGYDDLVKKLGVQ